MCTRNNQRTDLALESEQQARACREEKISGLEREEFQKGSFKISRICITDENASGLLEKPVGNYVTVSAPDGFDAMPERLNTAAEVIKNELLKIAGAFKSVLVVGLGNERITPDSVGVLVSRKIFATRHIKTLAPSLYDESMTEVSVIASGVTGNTGIESAEIVKALCEKTRPDVVFVIDALACSDIANLGKTVQITDTGISPGSGVGNCRAEISEATLGCRVVAVGIPTVIDMQTAVFQLSGGKVQKEEYASMMVTPRGIDKLVQNASAVIWTALNMALHPSISPDEAEILAG